jgi:hypothetical protein
MCIGCGTNEPLNFYQGEKSWCRDCRGNRVKGEALLKYECKVCGTTKISKFYDYLKTTCKKCYNEKSESPVKKKKKKVIIRILPYEE